MKSHEYNAQSKADYRVICLRLCRFLRHFSVQNDRNERLRSMKMGRNGIFQAILLV